MSVDAAADVIRGDRPRRRRGHAVDQSRRAHQTRGGGVEADQRRREVADELYISPKTVGRHVENIYTKIGVSTRAGAAVYAMENRLLG